MLAAGYDESQLTSWASPGSTLFFNTIGDFTAFAAAINNAISQGYVTCP